MRHRLVGGTLLAAAVLLAAPAVGWAQPGYESAVPRNTSPTIPIPTGQPGDAGFYTAVEFLYLQQNRAIGNQIIARRGFYDSTGRIADTINSTQNNTVTGSAPGTFFGSGNTALTTGNLGRSSFQPGFNLEIGYRLEDGTRIYGNYANVFEANYSDGATLVPRNFAGPSGLADTFITAPVFNFPPQFSGPLQKTGYDFNQPRQIIDIFGNVIATTPVFGDADFNPPGNTYGIWNGATTMDIKFSQRYTQGEIGARMPVLQTDYSKVYALAGARYGWFFERFTWQTVSVDINGISLPFYRAKYTETLSQRMYGPFVGCGHEIFLANQFSLSLDLTGAALVGIVKNRTKYELGDKSQESKRGFNQFDVIPNANAAVNLWWYPTDGVQLRVGYQAMSYFNTRYMREPVGFNFDAPDPSIDHKAIRFLHGFNVGFALFF